MNDVKSPMRITMAQINPVVGDIAGNAEKVISVCHEHADESDLIIFSELVLSGYQPEDLILNHNFINQCQKHAQDIAAQCNNHPAIIIGSPWLNDKNERQNCALFIHKGEIKHIIPKQELPNYGVFDEKRIFTAGAPSAPIDYMGHKLGIGICEDLWFPDVAQHLTDNSAELLISINGSPFDTHKPQKRLDVMRERVAETNLPFIYINQVGGQDETVYDGGSFALHDNGDLADHFMFFYDHVETIQFPFSGVMTHTPPATNQMTYNALKTGLHDYVTKNNFPGVLLGLSGGIDSALSAVIAVDALGANKVHCVMMPSPYTSQESLDDAKTLADNLGCEYEILNIQPAMDAYHNMLPNLSDIALENIQSRARGMALMGLSNTNGKMVLSTGNKSEMAVGYATLYGDMCGGFNALKDVYKTKVYELSRWRNEQDHIIPDNIITRAPSAELRPDQTDQDSLPDYDTLDAILFKLIEEKKSITDIVECGFDIDTVTRINSLLTRAEYKRRQSPPGVKISTCAFGSERRIPMTNRFDNE
jgi:NAD+ synthase